MSSCTHDECPICMDVLSGTKNIVTTECGHCFHTNCLMTSVAHNGFGCPYCRTQMAAAPADEEDSDDDDDSAWSSYDEDEELYGDHALRGARWLFQRANGEEVDEEEDTPDEEVENADIIVKPLVEFLTRKLVSQGITMENMVQALLVDHDEYDNSAAGADFNGILFGKMRILISNYKPEDDAPKVDIASVDSFYENRFMRVN